MPFLCPQSRRKKRRDGRERKEKAEGEVGREKMGDREEREERGRRGQGKRLCRCNKRDATSLYYPWYSYVASSASAVLRALAERAHQAPAKQPHSKPLMIHVTVNA
jgi:hypothetical protein